MIPVIKTLTCTAEFGLTVGEQYFNLHTDLANSLKLGYVKQGARISRIG